MAKIKIIMLSMVFLLSICGTHSYGRSDELSTRECIVSSSQGQLGVMEKGGDNRGPEVAMYLKSVKLGEGYHWCAAFVNWNLESCGIKTPKSAWAPSWFPNSRTIYYRNDSNRRINPQKGDVFGLYYTNLKRIGHVGIIQSWSEKVAVTIEGNTGSGGSRNGDGVYKRYRPTWSIYKVSDWIS